MKTAPQLSVIVPVYNGGPQLTRCLDALRASDFRAYEIVVVDDGSTDESAAAARARGVSVVQLDARRGPAAARNRGAAHTRGDIILFVDADVVVRADTLARVGAHFHERPGVAAVFGSYDDAPAATNFVSQFKNLLHHFVHQQAAADAHTFWAGCGAIRRASFAAIGGFDERRYTNPSIEDIELGYRLRRAGCTITLDKELQVKHLKRWTFASLLRTDIRQRALPWAQLILADDGLFNDLNLRTSERVAAALTGCAVVLLGLAYFWPGLILVVLATLTAICLLNFRCYRFLAARHGLWFAVRSFGMLLLYYFYSGTVFAFVYGAHRLKQTRGLMKREQPPPAAGRLKDV